MTVSSRISAVMTRPLRGFDSAGLSRQLALASATLSSLPRRIVNSRWVLQLGPPPARETRAARPRPGVPRTVTDDVVEEIVRLTLETKLRNAMHWSTRVMSPIIGELILVARPTS